MGIDFSDATTRRVATYLFLTFFFSSFFYARMIATGTGSDLGVGWMWCPGAAALITMLIYCDGIGALHLGFPGWRWLFIGYFTPLLYSSIVYGFTWVSGLGGFSARGVSFYGHEASFIVGLVFQAIVGLLPNVFSGLGEEIGWRGLLFPELNARIGYIRASLIGGAVWAAWHYPAILFADYRSTTPLWFQLSVFTLSVLGLNFFVNWLWLRSQSVWPAAVWHGSHNLMYQTIFLRLTVDRGLTGYVVDDFGIGLTLVSMVLAFACVRDVRGSLDSR